MKIITLFSCLFKTEVFSSERTSEFSILSCKSLIVSCRDFPWPIQKFHTNRFCLPDLGYPQNPPRMLGCVKRYAAGTQRQSVYLDISALPHQSSLLFQLDDGRNHQL